GRVVWLYTRSLRRQSNAESGAAPDRGGRLFGDYNESKGGLAVSATEETIDATLDPNGQLRLSHQPRIPPGPVRVTIRVAAAAASRRGLADVIREIATEQRSRGFPGRSAADLRAEEDARLDEDAERDRELDAARRPASPGGP